MTSGSDITRADGPVLLGKFGELGVALGDVLCGKYRVDGELGRGGMGVILAATHLDLGEKVALKILAGQDMNGRSLLRLRREAQIAARLRSEHVVRVMDIDEVRPGMPMMVMERLEGDDLASILRQRGALDVEQIVDWVIQTCDALAEAHARGIVHRDLKPSNLFIARRFDGTTILKVLDFGISKLDDPSIDLTATASLLGSPPYMSPEQILNAKAVDHRTDIWSLGIIFFEALAGRKPFDGASQVELMERISRAPVPAIGRGDVPSDLEAIVRACLEKDADRRISSALELTRRLERFAPAYVELMLARIQRIGSLLQPESARAVAVSDVDGTADDGEDKPSIPMPQTMSEDADEIPSDPLVGTRIANANGNGNGNGNGNANAYVIERKLGEGAMGTVYAALGEDGLRYAIKVLRERAGDSGRARIRFEREARAVSALRHDHVVRIHDVFAEGDCDAPTLVMELLQGRDLARVIRDLGRIEPVVVVRIFLQVCAGLAAAHAAGLVHRDIKPANIFLHEIGEEIQVKVCDFGIAKMNADEPAAAPSLTATGVVLGTPLYMAPEQARNAKHVDGRADIWAVCISMYEALSGKTPWSHCTTPNEVVYALYTEDAASLGKVAPWVDKRLVEVIHKGLRRNPADRWASVTDLRKALLPLVNGQFAVARKTIVAAAGTPAPFDAQRRPIWMSRSIAAWIAMSAVGAAISALLLARPTTQVPVASAMRMAPFLPTSGITLQSPPAVPSEKKPSLPDTIAAPALGDKAERSRSASNLPNPTIKAMPRKTVAPIPSAIAVSSARPPADSLLQLETQLRPHK